MKVSLQDWGKTVTVESGAEGVHITEFINYFCDALRSMGFSEDKIQEYIKVEILEN